MNNWFIFALLAPMIWAVINHIDKFVIARYAENKRPEALVIFSALSAGLAAALILIFGHIQNVSLFQALLGIIAGVLFVSAYIPYMYALQEDEVSIVGPLWQMVAPISYILGAVFLHEFLSLKQIFAGLLILVGAILMTLNFEKFIWKARVFKLMFISSLFIALNTLIFKIIGLESSFWTASFWEYLGAFIFGLILLSIKLYRVDFISFLKGGGKTLVSLNLLAESMNVVARLFFSFAAMLGPIALIYVVSGTQPFFIFLYGLMLFVFFPKIKKENFSRKYIILKIIAITIMFLGSLLLFL